MLWAMVIATGLASDLEVTPEVQVRPRLELHTGRDGAEGGEAWFVTQRSRGGVTLAKGPVSARIVLQDVRLWGEEEHTLFDFTANGLDLAWATLGWTPSDQASLLVGRQEINVHEHRLIGAVGWTSQGRQFDGATLHGESGIMSVDVGGAVLASSSSAFWDDEAGMAFLRAGVGPDGGVADVVYVLVAEGVRERMVHTVGAYAKGKTGPVSGRVEGYGQFGSSDGGTVGAWMVGLRGTVAPEAETKPSVTLWYDHLSGDDDPADGSFGAFDTLFDTRHKFYGWIDVFNFSAGGAADGRGLQDAALKLAIDPVSTVTAKLDAHLFMASAAQGGDSVLGEEVDAAVAIRAAPGLAIGAGGAVLVRPDLDPDAWAYLQLDAKLKPKKK